MIAMAKKTAKPDAHKKPAKTVRLNREILDRIEAIRARERQKDVNHMILLLIEDALIARGEAVRQPDSTIKLKDIFD